MQRGDAGYMEKQNIPIGHTGNGAFLELHDVAGQSPCLVRENVFHLYGQRKTECHLMGIHIIPKEREIFLSKH